MTDFFESVCQEIADRHLLPVGCSVIAGISGGADSMALLLILHQLREQRRLDLQAAHLNHGLRGDAADADEQFVSDWCRRLGVPLAVRRTDIPGLADADGLSLEEAGRVARHAFFSELADAAEARSGAGGTARIALAHHQDDQAETILLNLGRGAGLDGLAGMKYISGRTIRPLLGLPRSAIEAWLTAQQVSWRHDASNDELFALRNRLRLQVLPAWSAALGYDPAPLLARTAALLDDDRRLLDELATAARLCCSMEDGMIGDLLLAQPPALQGRIIRQTWRDKTGSNQNLTQTHVRLILDWLPSARAGQRLSLPDGWCALIAGDRLLIEREQQPHAEMPKPVCPVLLNLPAAGAAGQKATAITPLPIFNMQIRAELIENNIDIVYNDTTEYFHLGRIVGCVVRTRLPGDCIHPVGRSGGKTLKKFLNEQHVPADSRAGLMLVALDHEVVWLPGVAAGAGFAARPGDGDEGYRVRLTIEDLMADDL